MIAAARDPKAEVLLVYADEDMLATEGTDLVPNSLKVLSCLVSRCIFVPEPASGSICLTGNFLSGFRQSR